MQKRLKFTKNVNNHIKQIPETNFESDMQIFYCYREE